MTASSSLCWLELKLELLKTSCESLRLSCRLGVNASLLVRERHRSFAAFLRVRHMRCMVLADGRSFELGWIINDTRSFSSREQPDGILDSWHLVTFLKSSSTESLAKGFLREMSSKRRHPNDQMSDLESQGSPIHTSGEAYERVPVLVQVRWSTILLTLKSVILSVLSLKQSTFEGCVKQIVP